MGYMAFVPRSKLYGEEDYPPLDWGAVGQKIAADSTPSAEGMGLHSAVQKCLSMTQIVDGLLCEGEGRPMAVWGDNKAAAAAMLRGCSAKLVALAKAVQLKVRLARGLISLGITCMGRVKSADGIADGFTKVVARLDFERSRRVMGVERIARGWQRL